MAKPSYEEWVVWAHDELGIDYDAHGTLFKRNITTIHREVQTHPFFERMPEVLRRCASDYDTETGYPLFAATPGFTLKMKTFPDLLNKIYRRNCLWNRNFPNPPKSGWITPDNWFHEIADLVRGLLICRYADGPASVVAGLNHEAAQQGLEFSCRTLERDEGYYAYHSYVVIPVQILAIANGIAEEQDVPLKTEIQITTQLHDALGDISHEIYQKQRLAVTGSTKDWKWNFSSQEFLSSYIGHTLHLIEGLILDLRTKGTDDNRPGQATKDE
jgi:ppGpp synthetase/RelA/SpoT-type nucleotidyltranferase